MARTEPKKGDHIMSTTDPIKRISEIRTACERLTAEREALAKAPLSRIEAERQVDRRVDELASRLTIDPAPFVYPPGRTAQRRGFYRRTDPAIGIDIEELTAAAVAVTFGERLRALGREAVGRFYSDHAAGLPLQERASAIARIDRQLASLEVDEETEIRIAEARGLTIDRRPDCDPRLVLAEQLPSGPPSIQRLRAFLAVAERRYDTMRGSDFRRTEALDERGKHAGRLADAERDARRFPGGAGGLAAHRERAEQAQAELDRTTREYEELASQWQRAKTLADNLEKYGRTAGLAVERGLDPAPLRPVSQLQRLGVYDPVSDRIVPC